MAKRFTATEKWDDPWFFELDGNYKLAWLYLLDRCNHAGIWNVNMKLFEIYVGIRPEIEAFKGRVKQINQEKWFIPKFIEFQYGTLNPENRAHQSVIKVLEREGAYKLLTSSLQGAKDKDKDKESLVFKEGGVGETKPEPEPKPQDLIELWNSLAHPVLPRVQLLTEKRRTHVRCRLNEYPGKDFWVDLIHKVNKSPHLRGENDRGWKADFDWVLNPNNLAKILEGNYEPSQRR